MAVTNKWLPCLRACKETSTAAAAFARAKAELKAHCQRLEQLDLMRIDPKKVYHLSQFEALQTAHQEEVRPEYRWLVSSEQYPELFDQGVRSLSFVNLLPLIFVIV